MIQSKVHLYALKPSVIEVFVPGIATLIEPITTTSTTTAFTGFQITALVASRGHRRGRLRNDLTAFTDLDALDPCVIEAFVPGSATLFEPITATSTTTRQIRVLVGAALPTPLSSRGSCEFGWRGDCRQSYTSMQSSVKVDSYVRMQGQRRDLGV